MRPRIRFLLPGNLLAGTLLIAVVLVLANVGRSAGTGALIRPEYANGTLHVVAVLAQDGSQRALEMWIDSAASSSRIHEGTTDTWSDLTCSGRILTERYRQAGEPPMQFAVVRMYESADDCTERVTDQLLGLGRLKDEGRLRVAGEPTVAGRPAIRVVPVSELGELTEAILDERTGYILRTSYRASDGSVSSLSVTYQVVEVTPRGDVPAFSEDFRPSSTETYTDLNASDAIVMIAVTGVNLSTRIGDYEAVKGLAYDSVSAVRTQIITVLYRSSRDTWLEISLLPRALPTSEVGYQSGGSSFGVNHGERGLVAFSVDPIAVRAAARVITQDASQSTPSIAPTP